MALRSKAQDHETKQIPLFVCSSNTDLFYIGGIRWPLLHLQVSQTTVYSPECFCGQSSSLVKISSREYLLD